MDPVRLSIIVPTTGRPTLWRTLESASEQMAPVDELIVVADSAAQEWGNPHDPAEKFADVYLEVQGNGDRGNVARHRGMEAASGTHLLFMDDDDAYVPNAFLHIRANAHPERPVIFRMFHKPWQMAVPIEREAQVFKYGNVGTPCFVVPNKPDKLGTWAPWEDDHGSDWRFISETCEKMGDPIFNSEIIAVVRPHEVVVAFDK